MNFNLYNERQSYTVMKLDCMLQRAEILGSCDFNELDEFMVAFRQLNRKSQIRYEHLLELMMDLYDSEDAEICY